MTITKRITIDLQQPGNRQIVKAKQGDVNSRVVQIALYAGGVAWEPGTSITGVVQYRKSDGTGGAYDVMPDNATKAVTISGNQLTVNLAPQVLTAPGLVLCQVQLLSGSTILTTFCWCIDVEEDVMAGVASEDYYNVATLDALATQIKSLQTQLAAAQASITKAQQAAQTAQSTATAAQQAAQTAQNKANAALPKSGGAMTGNLYMGPHDIVLQDASLRSQPYNYPDRDGYRAEIHDPVTNGLGELAVASPTDEDSAANKGYVDEQVAGLVKTVNGQGPDQNGNVEAGGGVQTVNRKAPDTAGNVALNATDVGALSINGGIMHGALTMSSKAIDEIGMTIFGDGKSGFSLYSEGQGPAESGQRAKPRASFYGNYGDEPVELFGVADPTTPASAANKQYVDNQVAGRVKAVNGWLPDVQGDVILTAEDVGALPIKGGTMQGDLNMAGYKLMLDANKRIWILEQNGEIHIYVNNVEVIRITQYEIILNKGNNLKLGNLVFGDGDTGCYACSEGRMDGATSKPRLSVYGNYGDEPVELFGVADPTTPVSAANKQYVDQQIAALRAELGLGG